MQYIGNINRAYETKGINLSTPYYALASELSLVEQEILLGLTRFTFRFLTTSLSLDACYTSESAIHKTSLLFGKLAF